MRKCVSLQGLNVFTDDLGHYRFQINGSNVNGQAITMQSRPYADGLNGITNLALLSIVLDRMEQVDNELTEELRRLTHKMDVQLREAGATEVVA